MQIKVKKTGMSKQIELLDEPKTLDERQTYLMSFKRRKKKTAKLAYKEASSLRRTAVKGQLEVYKMGDATAFEVSVACPTARKR